MPKDLLIAQVTDHDDDGHGHFRVRGPARALARRPGVTVVDCDPSHRFLPWLIEEADVVVLHGVNPDLPPAARRRRAAGRVTLFEAADDYLDIQPWTDYSAGWLDRTLQDQFWHLLGAVDAVQTSTEELAARWSPTARRVFVFPNHLDEVPSLPPARTGGPLTVGWAGSVTHLPDWLDIAPAVERWVAARGDVRLAVMTDEAARGYVHLPPEKYEFVPRGTLADYNRFLARLDLAVVPLLPSRFNRGRTDLKWLELAARGVPGVFADAGPYRRAVNPGRTGLLYRTPADLVRHLDALADNPALRRAIRTAAHAGLAARRLSDHIGARLAAYRELLGGPGRGSTLPDALVAEAVADGRYFQLRAGSPENVLKSARRRPADDSVVRELEELLAAHPDYHAAARQLGRVLNELGQFTEAARVLEPLRTGEVAGPGALVELARSRLGLGDPATARRLLERAVADNPAHAPAWHLLLRLVGGEEGRAVADRARRNQPANYLAALAGVKFAEPAEVAGLLAGWLAEFGPGLHAEEMPFAAAAFCEAAARLDPADPTAVRVFAAACQFFPGSPRLADLHGEALRAAGHADEALAEFARALRLTRAALTAQLDGSGDPDRIRFWRVAEYARRARGEE